MLQSDILHGPTASDIDENLEHIQSDYWEILGQCSSVFTLLNEELGKLNVYLLNSQNKSTVRAKFSAIWNSNVMATLRDNVKGQAIVTTLLLAAFQAYVEVTF